MSKDALIKCDECKHEFFLKAVGINDAVVSLNGVFANLTYFACPKCNKIYRVSIQDMRYYELKEDFVKAQEKLRKYGDRHNGEIYGVLQSMVRKKYNRLAAYVKKVHDAFPGTFIFVASENNHEEKSIKYLP